MKSSMLSSSQGGMEFDTCSPDGQNEISATVCSNSVHPNSSSQNTEGKQKSSLSAPKGKKAIFSSLSHKFGHKLKAQPNSSPDRTVLVGKKIEPHSVEDGFVIVPRMPTADQQFPFGE